MLLATAFVHLLPTAFQSLTDPCLPYFFNQAYPPLPGLVAMASAIVVVGVESYLTARGAGHSHSHAHHFFGDGEDATTSEDATLLGANRVGLAASRHDGHRPADIRMDDMEAAEGLVAGVSPLPESTPTRRGKAVEADSNSNPGIELETRFNDEVADGDDDDDDLDLEELDPGPGGVGNGGLGREPYQQPIGPLQKRAGDGEGGVEATAEEQKRQMLQCLLLEAGILFHSVFIGMAISVATGPAFVVFLVAISFHQSFEGLALGSRIAAVQFPRNSIRPWLMVLAYGLTTPLGQAIGLIVHKLYDPASMGGLLVVGFMNAVSSGLLLYAGLVQLLAEDFLTEKSYQVLKGKRRLHAYLAVVAGALLMALVGAFA